MFTGIVNFDFRKTKAKNEVPFFEKVRPNPFSKVNVYRHCELPLSKNFRRQKLCEKLNPQAGELPLSEKKSPAHFQKLMFTGVVNFDFPKTKVRRQNFHFLKN